MSSGQAVALDPSSLDREQKSIIEAIGMASLDAVIAFEPEGTIVGWNSIAEKVFGWTADEAIGQAVHHTVVPESAYAAHFAALDAYSRSKQSVIFGRRLERDVQCRDGSIIRAELSIMRVPSPGPEVLICFLRDLTDELIAEAALRELQAKLVHFSGVSAMNTMASTIAHELSQPLTAVGGYLSGLKRAAAREKLDINEVRNIVDAASEALARASDIVVSVRHMVSKRPLKQERQQVRSMIEQSVRLLGDALITSPDITLDDSARLAFVNKTQMEQVIVNLVRNANQAVQLTKDPSIRICGVAEGDFIILRIIDNGPGFSSEIKESNFASIDSRKSDGLGVGLSICRTIVEHHGGKLWLESVDKGASVCFSMPIFKDEEENSP